MSRHWFSIYRQVPLGEGDYGSTRLCIFNGNSTPDFAMGIAKAAEKLGQGRVEVYVGHSIGKRIYRTQEAS